MADQATTPPKVATPPAAAAGAPAQAELLALRYSYSQLSPVHRNMADRLTALIIAYPDIVKLEDPKAQQDMIDNIVNSETGHEAQELLDKGSAAVKSIYEKLRKSDKTGVLNAGKKASDAAGKASDFVNGASRGLDVALLPGTMTVSALGELYNQSKVAWNGLDAKGAQKIATAYASTMQAQAVDRDEKGFWGTTFGSLGGAWAVFKALFASAGDMIAEYLPFTKDFMAKTFGSDPKRTLADNMGRQFAEHDIETVRTEMQKLGTRDGIDYAAWGSALTPTTKQGTVLQNRAGQDQPVTPPSADTPIPTLAGAQKDAKGDPVVAPTDRAAAIADATAKAGGAAKEQVRQVFGGNMSGAEKVGLAVGTAAAADGVYGVAQGVARTTFGEERSGPASRAAAANAQAEKLAEKAKTLRASEANPRFYQSAEKLGKKAAEMEAQAAAKAAEAAAHEAAQAARAGILPKKVAGFVAAAEEAPKGHWLLRAGNHIGRIVGDRIGNVTSWVADAVPGLAKAAPKLARGTGVAAAVLTPAIAGAGLVGGLANDDKAQVADSSGTLLTYAGDIAIGVGVAAGAAALTGATVLSAPVLLVGAGVGAAVGGATSFIGWLTNSEKLEGTFASYDATQREAAAKATPQAPAQTQPKAFSNEELLAMDEGVKRQVQNMCSAKSNKGVINFNLGTAFRSVDCTSIGALSSSASAGTGGGRTVVAAQAAPAVAGG